MEQNNPVLASETEDPLEQQKPPVPSVVVWGVLVAIAFVLGIVTSYLVWARPLQDRVSAVEQKVIALEKQSAAANADSAPAADTAQQQAKRYPVETGNNPSIGPQNAPITIIEFSDYECPFCQRWHQEVYAQLEKEYGDKVRLVYRDFPLYGLHPNAEAAAEAADCAGEQKKYWPYHDLLLSGQKQFSTDVFLNYASSLKLNTDDFKKCVDEHRYQSQVKANYDYASQLGVRSTPTFFINGLAVVGAQPFDVFKQIIDMELQGKIPK